MGSILHPDLTPAERRRLLQRGVELYRAGRYFDCHEAFEEVWRSSTPEPKDLLQGLIQIAVAVYHFRRGKPAVSARVMAKGRRRVEPYPSPTLGLDLDHLREGVGRWEDRLRAGEAPGEPPELRIVDESALR